jgi:phosphoribosylanthranilate isomerase
MKVKICGLRSRAEMQAAADCGADYVGLVFYPRSPRHVSLADAKWIAGGIPEGLTRVALVVDADDATLAALLEAVPIDILQLHGQETPERVEAVRATFGKPVMKAVGLATAADLPVLETYAAVADRLLIDARPPADADLPGGNGVAFDWRLLDGARLGVPWMLAGGLTPENVAEAVQVTGAREVDVSSGVEISPGYKDPERMAAFVAAARAAGKALDGADAAG